MKMGKPKVTKEQRQARSLNTSLDPSPTEKRMYEVATYRSARKHRGVNAKSKGK